MIFSSAEEFLEKADACSPMRRAMEVECARRMRSGDADARQQLIRSYLPMVAAHVRRLPKHMQNLGLVLYCLQELEKAVDTFDFLQDSEPFAHRLSWHLRQATVKYTVR